MMILPIALVTAPPLAAFLTSNQRHRMYRRLPRSQWLAVVNGPAFGRMRYCAAIRFMTANGTPKMPGSLPGWPVCLPLPMVGSRRYRGLVTLLLQQRVRADGLATSS